jgi:hypothetical protein
VRRRECVGLVSGNADEGDRPTLAEERPRRKTCVGDAGYPANRFEQLEAGYSRQVRIRTARNACLPTSPSPAVGVSEPFRVSPHLCAFEPAVG